MKQNEIESLSRIGLNQLEAEVYTLLLPQEPMTAYRIGKLLGKPTANVYKAIDSLESKGAVIVEEGNNRICRAVPISEFLKHLEQDFLKKTKQAARSLSHLKVKRYDERIYKLQSISHIFSRCTRMLDRCKAIAVIDAFPKPLEAIQGALLKAIKRGVEIFVQAYEPVDIPGARLVIPPQSDLVLKYWSSQQLNVVTDGKEHILALFDQGLSEIYHATWSRNLYLSCILHAGLMHEHNIHRIRAVQESKKMPEKVREILSKQKFFHNSNIPGQKELFSRYSVSKEPPSKSSQAKKTKG